MNKLALVAATAGLIAVVGCGRIVSASPPSPPGTIPASCLGPDGPGWGGGAWDYPADGDLTGSISQARPSMSVPARMPNGLGSPIRMILAPPAALSSGSTPRALFLVFDQSPYGRVIAMEQPWQGPNVDYSTYAKSAASDSASVPCGPTAEAVTIKGGQPALLTHSIDGSVWAVSWREGSMELRIMGPHLTRDQALKIADAA